MKSLLVVLTLIISAQTMGSAEPFCLEKAKEWQEMLHEKNLDDIGVIQGYFEETSYTFSTVRHQMDNATETIEFKVDASNDEGDGWTWGYKVVVEAWLGADGKPWICDVMKAEYQGVLENRPYDPNY